MIEAITGIIITAIICNTAIAVVRIIADCLEEDLKEMRED